MIALAKLYMPFRNNEILVRANIHKLGFPLQCFTEFKEALTLGSSFGPYFERQPELPDSTRAR